jgi:hypothetical protein
MVCQIGPDQSRIVQMCEEIFQRNEIHLFDRFLYRIQKLQKVQEYVLLAIKS